MEIALEREQENDFERERRRRMEIAREREQERNNGRKEQFNTTGELVMNNRTNGDLERRMERVRQEEIAREIHKAEQKKKKILQEMARPDTLGSKRGSIRDNRESYPSENDSKGQADQVSRTGDALERVERQHARDTLREGWRDGRADSAFEEERRPRHRDTIRRKPPILIIEQIPVMYSGPAGPGEHSQTDRDPNTWHEESSLPGSDYDFEDPHRGTPFIDRRAPDRPVALPRPDTAYTDRRPDRPDYPYKYDEIHITIPGDSTELLNPDHIDHTLHTLSTDDLPQGQGSPAGGAVRSPSLGLRAPHIFHHHIPSLAVGGNAAHAQLALEQALIAEQALQAQAIQAGQIKQAAVAAQLAGHVAAQHLAAQKIAAQKVATQIIAAGNASAKRKATQLSQILAGNAAVKAAIKTNLEHGAGHRLKKLLSQKAAGAALPGPGLEAQLGLLAANSFHQHHLSSANINQLREELIHRLTLLK